MLRFAATSWFPPGPKGSSMFACPKTRAVVALPVDDLTLSGPAAELESMISGLKKDLLLKTSEPLSVNNPLVFPGRQLCMLEDGSIRIVPSQALIAKLGETLGPQPRSNLTSTPSPTNYIAQSGEKLGPSEHATFRSAIGIMQYLAGDGPDIQWTTKAAARALACSHESHPGYQ
jgi:hypothetical protein